MNINIQKKVNLAKYSTLGVGGDADYLTVVNNAKELVEALDYGYKSELRTAILGGGSNVLISDEGFRGLVIINRDKQFEVTEDRVTVHGGVILSALVKNILQKKLFGLEFATGIPGTVGGAVVGNVGANGGQIADVLLSAEVWADGTVTTWSKADLDYGYRYSKLKGHGGSVVVSATFELHSIVEPRLLAETEIKITKQIAADVLRRNRYYLGRTAGSYFKNPEGERAAAELIDQLELKGYRIGGAEISPDHANVFRNAGEATADDFYKLEMYVVEKVKEEFDILLFPEVVKIGEFK